MVRKPLETSLSAATGGLNRLKIGCLGGVLTDLTFIKYLIELYGASTDETSWLGRMTLFGRVRWLAGLIIAPNFLTQHPPGDKVSRFLCTRPLKLGEN